MVAAVLPPDEESRLIALRSYGVLDTAIEHAFADIVGLAARLTKSPIALVSLVDADRQWFKAHHGLSIRETPRTISFCAHAILHPEQPFIVEDAAQDPRFADNTLVTGDPGIRSYLGVPLVTPEGFTLGTLCVIDRRAREFDQACIDNVQSLARAVTATLELGRMTARAEQAALIDSLTGLLNRRAVDARMKELAASRTHATIIALDLDHLKEANDRDGHAAGDALLRAAADRLSEHMKPGDILGRVGGDEFVAVLAGVSEKSMAAETVERIALALRRPVPHAGKLLRLSATFGVAVGAHDPENSNHLLRAADEMLVRAKRQQRGSVGWADTGTMRHLERTVAILSAFDSLGPKGVSSPGIFAHLQPIVSLAGTAHRVVAVEALARWNHPATGPIATDELFAMLGPERANCLSSVVRRQALALAASLRVKGLLHARIALNLSASEVTSSDIGPTIADEVCEAGLSLDAVEIEITEDLLLDRVSSRTLDQLAVLRGRGARLILDDFGTGTSGLAQLLRLPLDGLKLDKRFTQRLGTDKRAKEIVRAIVSLARGLGMTVVAEGVETERQAAIAAYLGCDAGQGFLFARPLDAVQLEVWLAAQPDKGDVLHLNRGAPEMTAKSLPRA